MLIPIGDDNQGRLTTPFIVYIFIAINAVVFLALQQAGGRGGDRFTYGYSTIPYEITTGEDLKYPVVLLKSGNPPFEPISPEQYRQLERIERVEGRQVPVIPEAPGPSPIYFTLLSSMFMHGGCMHIIGNMLYLWIFGDNIEDNFGHGMFAIFYIICGLVASFAQILMMPQSPIPSLGASGAIAGVLGAYLVMFPHNRVRAILPLGYIWTTVELPALVVLGFWIVLQIISQYTASIGGTTQTEGVAYMAHIGGFVAGMALSFIFRRRRPRSPQFNYWDGRY